MPETSETTPSFVGARSSAPRGAAPFPWERRLLAAHSALVYLFLYAPIAILIVFSFNAARQTARWEGFTVQWYARLMENKLILASLKNSLIVASATTLVATIIGTLAALALARYSFRGKAATRAALFLPIIIPEIVLGAALVTFFGAIQMRLSIWTVIISHIAFSISYVAIVVRARLAGFDRALEEAAMDLGAGPVQTFLRVTLPVILPGVIAGALLVFTISIDDYVVSSFVAGVGATTLPLQIYSMIKVGVTPEVNAVSTLLLLATVVMILISQRLQREPGGGPGR
jgi:spermidine/putrescine transport system permease protein